MSELQSTPKTIELAAGIVSAFVSNNSVPVTELPALISNVHAALTNVAQGTTELPKEELRPAVPVRKSVQPNYIVCLDDGKRFKSLKRHLRTVHNLTPDQYRAKWGLPATYPMVAPTTPQSALSLPSKWALVRSVGRRRNQSLCDQHRVRNDGARRPLDPIGVACGAKAATSRGSSRPSGHAMPTAEAGTLCPDLKSGHGLK